MVGFRCFLPEPPKYFIQKMGRKLSGDEDFRLHFFFPSINIASNVAHFFALFFFSFFFLFFLFLGNHIASCHFFIPFFLRHLHCLFFFSFDFLGIRRDFFFFTGCDFFWNMFFIFISNLGDFSFLCGYLSLFYFNLVSLFNKGIWVNLFKLIFSIP